MFSVIIPLYNKELSIKHTIQSVLKQTIQDFEIVIVNDGSTDDSAKIVEGINDSRVRLIHQKNKGVSAARNYGVEKACNQWVAFLDGDDLWEVNHLEEITKMMSVFPNEKFYVTSFKYSDDRKISKCPRQTSIFKIENYFEEVLVEELICTGIVVVDKNCFNKVGGFNKNLNLGEDLDLWARLAHKYEIIKSSVVTATYRVEAENRSSLSKEVKNTCVYHFKLSPTLDLAEKKYYKELILSHIFQYFVALDYLNVMKLKNRHPNISYNETICYISKRVKLKISKKLA